VINPEIVVRKNVAIAIVDDGSGCRMLADSFFHDDLGLRRHQTVPSEPCGNRFEQIKRGR
jgi:hypothetical protein